MAGLQEALESTVEYLSMIILFANADISRKKSILKRPLIYIVQNVQVGMSHLDTQMQMHMRLFRAQRNFYIAGWAHSSFHWLLGHSCWALSFISQLQLIQGLLSSFALWSSALSAWSVPTLDSRSTPQIIITPRPSILNLKISTKLSGGLGAEN